MKILNLFKLMGPLLALHLFFGDSEAQTVGNYLGDESFFYAQTKQINQFFRRFNCEEDLEGNRIYEGDENYHDTEFRRKYIRMLFDKKNTMIGGEKKDEFIKDVTEKGSPEFLDFFGGQWYGEVTARFTFNGQEQTAIIFLSLEQERKGHKWVITNVYFQPFAKMFYGDSTVINKFLHPMSHELDFMNLIRVFNDPQQVEYYFKKDFQPDYKSIFLYEVKKGALKFETIKNVRFHFFQVDNWYFEISEFNRSDKNSGWLISALTQIPEDQKEMLLKYIYYEK